MTATNSILSGALLAIFATSLSAQGHPHFDDGGALQWQANLAAAKKAAKQADKLIFIEYGRTA